MTTNRKYRNDLKTGTGIHKFMIPASADLLTAPLYVVCSDDLVPEEVKDHNLKISYSPQVYIIRLNPKNEPVLTDICGKECEVPRVMASFREGQIPEIRINGFALCIDKQSMNLINAQDNPARKKEMLQKTGQYFQEFSAICGRNPLLSLLHELKHLQNNIKNGEICGGIDNSQMSAEQFAVTRYADEISATTREFLYCVEQYNKTGKDDVFPKEFLPFKQLLSRPETRALLHNPQKLTEYSVKMWLNNPRNESYTGTSGDFKHQTDQYAEKSVLPNCDSNAFSEIIKAYFSFEFEGKPTDCSKAAALIRPVAHIYTDAQEVLEQRAKTSNRQMIMRAPLSGRGA